jgi:hypothetical protein
MLADCAVRLAFGLTVALLVTSWRAVPVRFFRTLAQVVLGLLVLAALDQARLGGHTRAVWWTAAAAGLSYVGAVGWGLGLPLVGVSTSLLIFFVTAGWLVLASSSVSAALWAANTLSRFASGFVMGSTLLAMLLGHHYLTAPSMSIEPLKRIVALSGVGLAARAAMAGLAMFLLARGSAGAGMASAGPDLVLFLGARWGLGFLGAAVATYLTWRTVQIRSTQSATGILYITLIFLLFGELTSLILAGRVGFIC